MPDKIRLCNSGWRFCCFKLQTVFRCCSVQPLFFHFQTSYHLWSLQGCHNRNSSTYPCAHTPGGRLRPCQFREQHPNTNNVQASAKGLRSEWSGPFRVKRRCCNFNASLWFPKTHWSLSSPAIVAGRLNASVLSIIHPHSCIPKCFLSCAHKGSHNPWFDTSSSRVIHPHIVSTESLLFQTSQRWKLKFHLDHHLLDVNYWAWNRDNFLVIWRGRIWAFPSCQNNDSCFVHLALTLPWPGIRHAQKDLHNINAKISCVAYLFF